jgi:deazaflavin-dependent oxidoreductase (nitroreductase family)
MSTVSISRVNAVNRKIRSSKERPMSFTTTPPGTHGARIGNSTKPPGPMARWLTRRLKQHTRRKGGRFLGMDVLFLTTIGRRTAERRESPVAWFADGPDSWLIVASYAGSARNPAWYLNLAAHPDQIWIELPDRSLPVVASQLDDEERAAVWPRIVAAQPRYAKYQSKTDRQLPVIRLVPAD